MTRSARAALLAACACASLLVLPGASRADEAPGRKAMFALIIGSNSSVDAELPPLRYADDDAARYVDLFRLLGARTYLLTRPDENTARLHPQAAAEALLPRRAELDRVISQAVADVAQAHARGVGTIFYFLYAGHGSVHNGQGYITLEDARITGADVASQVVERVAADEYHIVIDACDSYLFAYPRGPGGSRRPVNSFGQTPGLVDDPRVGLLLSASSSRESHEWDAIQAGVFSHEVRSGLYGAADADGDGLVSYREIAAFVTRANVAIPNERFRPEVHARQPRATGILLDITPRLNRRVEIPKGYPGHYVLEDGRGVRVAETHTAAGTAVRFLRGAPNGREYLRRVDDEKEFVLPADQPVALLSDLSPDEPHALSHGAAHDAFDLLFTLPFDETSVQAYGDPGADWSTPAVAESPPRQPATGSSVRRPLGWTALGVGAAMLGAGAAFSVGALSQSSGSSPTESERDASARNDRIHTYDTLAVVGYAAGGAAVATGLFLLLWPDAPRGATVTAAGGGFTLGYGTSF